MTLKHGKYIYIARKDGWYVKVRVLNIRLKKKEKKEYSYDINDASRYIVVGPKVKKVPFKAQVLREEDIPDEIREQTYKL